MHLYLNDTSPFSRVVVATALLSRCAPLTLVWVDPWSSPTNLKKVNPFCLIPTIELEDGSSLTESLCICQYLIDTYQPQAISQVANSRTKETQQLGFAKTLMEIAFRSAALARYTEKDNELIKRGKEGIIEALQQLNQQLRNDGIESYLAENLATLYLHVALDYVQFRHGSLFDEVEHSKIVDFLNESPFSELLAQVSIEHLASKPKYAALLAECSY
ncbi:glutathione S-transferase [Vibrio sp. T187]|uniref:glutathione S-transferase family protein n=1 Tax=Vibrio TaxID=662 RepID=UPI0010C9A3E9|nr:MULTISPECIES: glutathione S-transferase family protein [Vibrio]MBW3696854.1 glutathione S-transferase [Vibrio sp. T187]